METASSSWMKYLGYLIFVLFVLFAYSWINSPMIITVTGTGEVSAPAESATLTFSLSSNAESAQGSTDKVKELSFRIKETLKTNGIPESDIYEASIVVLPAASVVPGSTGYQSTLSMGVKTTQVNNLDGLTSSLYSSGALVVTQPVFSVGIGQKLEDDAYNLAIKDAKGKANKIALSNLKLIKKIVLIEQSSSAKTSTVTSKADSVTQIDNNLSAEDGLIKISKVVSVSYKMW